MKPFRSCYARMQIHSALCPKSRLSCCSLVDVLCLFFWVNTFLIFVCVCHAHLWVRVRLLSQTDEILLDWYHQIVASIFIAPFNWPWACASCLLGGFKSLKLMLLVGPYRECVLHSSCRGEEESCLCLAVKLNLAWAGRVGSDPSQPQETDDSRRRPLTIVQPLFQLQLICCLFGSCFCKHAWRLLSTVRACLCVCVCVCVRNMYVV